MERDFTVLFRIRPSFTHSATAHDEPALISSTQPGSVVVREPRTKLSTHSTDFTHHTFSVDHCYLPTSTTEETFNDHVERLIPFVLSGGHATLLAYGQTGSGKTFTLSSLSRLAILSLFSANSTCHVSVSAIEIYGKSTVNDLFDEENRRVVIGESIQGNSVFSRATVKENIQEGEEMVRVVEEAWGKRKTRGTEKNPISSRSHALIRLVCQKTDDPNATPGVLQLVDLAGSERASDHSPSLPSPLEKEKGKEKKLSTATRMAETVAINTTLMTLKACVRSRTSPRRGGVGPPHIPFRSSKLTLALKEAFDLYSRQPTHTVFIATASPDLPDLPATLNTFRYAAALVASPHARIELKPDAEGRNVFFWSPSRVEQWLVKYSPASLSITEYNVGGVVKGGERFSKVPEQKFYENVSEAIGRQMNERERAAAREVYLKWWKLVIASRTLSQKALQDEWKQRNALKLKQEQLETAQNSEVEKLLNLPSIAAV